MPSIDDEIRSLLELGPGDSLDLACAIRLPTAEGGQGLGVAARLAPLAMLLATPLVRPVFGTQPESVERPAGLAVEIGRDDRGAAKGVAYIEPAAGAVIPLIGTVERNGGLWVLDGRQSAAVVRVVGPDGEFVVQVTADQITCQSVRRSPSALVERLLSSASDDDPAWRHPAPHPDALCEGWATSSWLRDAGVDRATWGGRYGEALGAGMLARFWTPADPATRARVLAGEELGPRLPVLEWARSLTDAERGTIEESALAEAGAWLDELDRLRTALVEGDESEEDAADRALHLLLRRDDLESAAWVLHAAGGGESLRARLKEVDEEARGNLSALPIGSRAASNVVLRAVSWQSPLDWWGAVAVES